MSYSGSNHGGDEWQAIAGVLFVSSVFYGIHLTVGSTTLYLNQRRRRTLPPRQYIRNLCCLASHLLFGSMNMFSIIAVYGAKGQKEKMAFGVLFMIATIVVTLSAGALMLIRCCIIWNHKRWVVAAPALLLIATCIVGLSLIGKYMSLFSGPHLSPDSVLAFRTFWIMALFVNLSLTALILVKVIRARRSIDQIIRSTEQNNPNPRPSATTQKNAERMKDIRKACTGVICLCIESSALYTVAVAIGVIVTASVPNIVVTPIVVQSECVASELIILRAIWGKAWTPSTFSTDLSDDQGEKKPSAVQEDDVEKRASTMKIRDSITVF